MKRLQFRSIARMRGAVAVEMALLLIPMLVLVFGVAEFGRAIYQYDTLTKSVRTATRYLSQVSPGSSSDDAEKFDKLKGEAICLAVYGDLTKCNSETPLVPGLVPSMVQVSTLPDVPTSSGAKITLIKICIEKFSFQFLLDPRTLLGGGEQSITFGPICSSMRQS